MSGTNNVASMVVATNGLADKASYRKFKMRTPGNNDFVHMHEAMTRRFSGRHADWPKPQLILIDGGKGQLSSALSALEEQGMEVPVVGLAKREEEIIVHKKRSNVTVDIDAIKAWVAESSPFEESSFHKNVVQETGFLRDSDEYYIISLPKNSHIVKLLQRLRDESHRFAVSYHTHLKRSGQTKSILDDIPSVGPTTRKKLLKAFGSVDSVRNAPTSEIATVVGLIKAKTIKAYLQKEPK
jgi:excinuclease ABC subunit C